MNRTALTLAVGLVLGAAAGASAHTIVVPQQAQPTTRTSLVKLDLPECPGKEANMWITEIAPGAATPRHSHPGHVFGYVLEGSLTHTVEKGGKAPSKFSVGSAWYEMPGEVHFATNRSATKPVKLIAVGVVEKGQPLSIPAK